MTLQNTDIVIYGSANMQEMDADTPQGGAIDTSIKMTFTDLSVTGKVNVVSDNVSDSGTVAVRGRSAGGSIINETIDLLGTTVASGLTDFERILRVYSTGHLGTITMSTQIGATGLATLESGIDQVRRPFMTVTGDMSGGSARNFYEKVFIQNNSLTNDLVSAVIMEGSDGTEANGADITFDLESSLNGTGTSTNRITAPSSGSLLTGTFDDVTKSVPGGSLPFGDHIGAWLKLNIPANTVPMNTTYVMNASGATT